MSTDTRIDAESAPATTDSEVAATEHDSPSADVADTRRRDGEAPSTGRRWPRRIGVTALLLVTTVAAACAVVLGWKLKDARDVASAADQARATARNYAVTLTSVNSDGLDQNFTDVLDGATGEFKEMYAQSSEQLKQLLIDNQATAQGTVIEDGIKSATKTKVEVLLFVDQSVTNTVTPDPRMDRSRVVMTMELVDGRWLASEVELP